jgi:hypothetical protein
VRAASYSFAAAYPLAAGCCYPLAVAGVPQAFFNQHSPASPIQYRTDLTLSKVTSAKLSNAMFFTFGYVYEL